MPSPNSKLVSVGSHTLSSCPPTSLQEYQWDVNNLLATYTSGQLLKFTYRHAPKGETMESVFLDYRVVNDNAAPVAVLPLWSSIRELRVYINNKKTVDWNREEQCRTSWQTKLLTSHDTDNGRQNQWFWQTGLNTVLDGTGNFNPVVVAGGGGTHQFHLNFEDFSDVFSCSLPLTKVGLIEVEMNLSSRADFVCSPQADIGGLRIEDITVYSRHKVHLQMPPSAMSAFTMFHRDYDVFQLAPTQHPFDTAAAGTEFDVNISTEFPKRNLIQRIIVFARDPADADAFRQVDSSFVQRLELLRGGLTFLGTDNHYDSERKIFKEISNWAKRHHSMAWPTHPGEVGHGEAFYSSFIDCTTVQHNLNNQASADVKNVEVNGVSNQHNLVLRITKNANVTSATANLVILMEYMRFDRLLGNGAVVKVLEAHP